ncbi:MAG: DNA topoisomerase VI subunit B, partial [Candidatus Krumholzibacteria bacterium]|nr:DNA topoisomerase VI subunit B [Candidatus Krumholzibacteria bacterium]
MSTAKKKTKTKKKAKTSKKSKKKLDDEMTTASVETLPLFADADNSDDASEEAKSPQGGSKASRVTSGKNANGTNRRNGRSYQTAQSIAQKQREISVSEFFAKNRHMLGFDSPTRALLTVIKEAVDNSLDACEEAGILPDIRVQISEISDGRYGISVADSGPGIVKSHVPKIFGKLLYGSKFHTLRQSRGQQGIGISAAGMYGQLTTGRPVTIYSRTGPDQTAHRFEIQLDMKKNEPVVLADEETIWEVDQGTRVEIVLTGSYKRGQHSVDTYLQQTAIANPHVQLTYCAPKGEPVVYESVAAELPVAAVEIQPHPHGVELGMMARMLKETKCRNVSSFLKEEFCRVGPKTAEAVLTAAQLPPRKNPKRLQQDDIQRLLGAITETKIPAPPTDCLSPIGEELVLAGLQHGITADFYTSVTRPAAVYRGNPFRIEVGLAYGGQLPGDELARVMRFANRVPLLYQASACAIHKATLTSNWRSYGLQQSRGALPTGPLVILVHMASVWVPFTSESKEAVAHYPEII